MVVKAWRAAWAQVVPFFAFPPDVRRVIYTTNALESVHRRHPQDHQNPRPFSERRRRDQTGVARAAQYLRDVDAPGPTVETRAARLRPGLRRSLSADGDLES